MWNSKVILKSVAVWALSVGVCAAVAHRSPSIGVHWDSGDREAQRGGFACRAQQGQGQALQQEP